MKRNKKKLRFERPKHIRDNGHAHIQFGEDPKPNLQKYGYCVVENVFTKKECTEKIEQIWDWLEGLGRGIDRKSSKTWSNKNWPLSRHQGMIQNTLAHEEFMWTTREHPNVVRVFEQIHGTDKLLSSFDGATFSRPPETKYIMSSALSWLHTDQNLIPESINLESVYTSSYYSIQGVANFEDVEDEDGSLFIGEKSHLVHRELFKFNKKKPNDNWYKIDKKDLNWLQRKQNIIFIKVNAPYGSLILFDSRCIHSGFPAQKRKKMRFRYVIYVALTPASRATERDYANKFKSIKQGRCTTHWSSNGVKLFGQPRIFGTRPDYLDRKENIKDISKWSLKRKLLAGIVRY